MIKSGKGVWFIVEFTTLTQEIDVGVDAAVDVDRAGHVAQII